MGERTPTELLTDPDWLQACLDAGGTSTIGQIVNVGVERIGLGYGLSGEIHRLHCTTDEHDHTTVVGKVDDRELIARAVAAHRLIGSRLGRSKPALLGHDLDALADRGVVLLDDVRPAVQGDELRSIGSDEAAELVAVVCRLHRIPCDRAGELGIGSWSRRQPNPETWEAILERLTPQLDSRFGRGWRRRLERLDADAVASSASLVDRPVVLLHGDPHLDNVLWRTDGSTVLLDWSSVQLGPAALDIAVLLSSLCFTERPTLSPEQVIDQVAEPTDPSPIESARAAMTNLVRGQLGWAGRPDAAAAHPRVESLLDGVLDRIEREITWIDLGAGRTGGVSDRTRR